MKAKWSLIYLNDLTQLQTWLDDQAARGWYLESCCLRSLAKFRNREHGYIRYRLEPIDRSPSQVPPAEQRAFFAEAGWEYVDTICGLYDVYAARDPAVQDLYTDADTLATALERRTKDTKARLMQSVVCILLALLVLFGSPLVRKNRALALLHTDYLGAFLRVLPLLLCWVLAVMWCLRDQALIRRQTRRLETEGLEPYRPYPTGLLAWLQGLLRSHWFTCGVAAAALVIMVWFGGGRFPSMMPLDELPGVGYAAAEELFPGGREVESSAYGWSSTFASPSLSIYQEVLDSGGERWSVSTRYYETRWESLAEQALTEQMAEWRDQYGQQEPLRVETVRAEEAWILNWDVRRCIATRDGCRLIFIDIWQKT